MEKIKTYEALKKSSYKLGFYTGLVVGFTLATALFIVINYQFIIEQLAAYFSESFALISSLILIIIIIGVFWLIANQSFNDDDLGQCWNNKHN